MNAGHAPALATPAVTFVPEAGGVAALLGVWRVGQIVAFRQDYGWRVTLPEVPGYWRAAVELRDAKAALSACVLQWIDAAGLAPALPPAEPPIRAFREAGAL